MINSRIKSTKGISLISLVITVTVLVILTNVVLYNVKDNLKVGKLKEMQNDIANLKDKVASYYAQNGKIPASIEYTNETNINRIRTTGVISAAADTGKFLVIDLSSLENLTLNNGKDYEKVKATPENVNNYDDLYIINETSHNIFYVAGITVDNETFYTDYTSEDVDLAKVDLRYVENIKIPDGFYYVEGTKDTGIVIRSNDNTQEYEWIIVNNIITELPEGVEVEDSEKEEFIKSVNAYQGYYKSKDTDKVIYLELEKWSPIYDTKGIYKDKNGDTAYIPKGFQVSEEYGQNTVEDGLVIRDDKQNEYVWIPCTEAEYEKATNKKDEWSQYEYSNKTWDDTTVADTISYADRLASVKEHEGFYVARYEAGIPEEATGVYANTDGATYNIDRNKTDWTPVSKKGVQAWNYISQTNAKTVAKKMVSNETVQSYLIDSYAWDMVCKKIDSKYGTDKNIKNSKTWGNYYDNTTTNYESINTLFAVHTNNSGWTFATNYQKGSVTEVPKGSGTNRLELATGASEDFKAYNLYDFTGNMWEWTTEQSTEPNDQAVLRGGSFGSGSSGFPVVCRHGYVRRSLRHQHWIPFSALS